MVPIAERISYIRKSLGLTQSDFADRISITKAYISHLETGKREPSDLIISAICSQFNVNEKWLRTGDGEPFFDQNVALQRMFAAYFIEISYAFTPVFSSYGEMMPLFNNVDIMRMYNYLALRVKRGGYGKRNINALISSFDASFPGYEDAVKVIEKQSVQARLNIEASPIARRLLPVQGVAAAGSPLYDDSTDGDQQGVPAKYGDGRFFVVRVKGDSMSPKINDGDHVVVSRGSPPENGELALVFIAGKTSDEYVVKLFQNQNGTVRLSSYNTMYSPISVPISQIVSAEKIVHIIHGLSVES